MALLQKITNFVSDENIMFDFGIKSYKYRLEKRYSICSDGWEVIKFSVAVKTFFEQSNALN